MRCHLTTAVTCEHMAGTGVFTGGGCGSCERCIWTCHNRIQERFGPAVSICQNLPANALHDDQWRTRPTRPLLFVRPQHTRSRSQRFFTLLRLFRAGLLLSYSILMLPTPWPTICQLEPPLFSNTTRDDLCISVYDHCGCSAKMSGGLHSLATIIKRSVIHSAPITSCAQRTQAGGRYLEIGRHCN